MQPTEVEAQGRIHIHSKFGHRKNVTARSSSDVCNWSWKDETQDVTCATLENVENLSFWLSSGSLFDIVKDVDVFLVTFLLGGEVLYLSQTRTRPSVFKFPNKPSEMSLNRVRFQVKIVIRQTWKWDQIWRYYMHTCIHIILCTHLKKMYCSKWINNRLLEGRSMNFSNLSCVKCWDLKPVRSA